MRCKLLGTLFDPACVRAAHIMQRRWLGRAGSSAYIALTVSPSHLLPPPLDPVLLSQNPQAASTDWSALARLLASLVLVKMIKRPMQRHSMYDGLLRPEAVIFATPAKSGLCWKFMTHFPLPPIPLSSLLSSQRSSISTSRLKLREALIPSGFQHFWCISCDLCRAHWGLQVITMSGT